MSLLYVPLMAAKRGEFTALTNLDFPVLDRTMPLFELPSPKQDAKEFEKSIIKTAAGAGKAWLGRRAFLDTSKWKPNARTESGVHVLEYAFSQFHAKGVLVNPVVGYDRWDDPAYQQALKNICMTNSVNFCIRLDRESIQNDMLDIDYFSERMAEIFDSLEIGVQNCYVILDFGNVASVAVADLIETLERAIGVVRGIGFSTVIVAGGSMPTAVNEAVAVVNTEGCIPRIEMLAWKAIFAASKDRSIVFGDYLIRNPEAAEGVIAPNANAKIRYTILNQYFIVRGESKKLESMTSQHKRLAATLVKSANYMEPSFSWGDSEIFNCSIGIREIREATTMIAVDSNHHIKTVVLEVLEYQRTFIPSIDEYI